MWLGWLPPSHIRRWERVALTSVVAMVIQQPFPCHLHGNLGGPSVLRPLLLKEGALGRGWLIRCLRVKSGKPAIRVPSFPQAPPYSSGSENESGMWGSCFGVLGTALSSRVREAALPIPSGDSPGNARPLLPLPHQVPQLLSRTARYLTEGGKRDSLNLSKAGHHTDPWHMAGWLSAAP